MCIYVPMNSYVAPTLICLSIHIPLQVHTVQLLQMTIEKAFPSHKAGEFGILGVKVPSYARVRTYEMPISAMFGQSTR